MIVKCAYLIDKFPKHVYLPNVSLHSKGLVYGTSGARTYYSVSTVTHTPFAST